MNGRLAIVSACVLVAWSVSGSTAEPVRAAVDQKLLPETALRQLRQSIDRARNETPEAFAAIDRVIAYFPEMKAQSFGRGPTTISFALRYYGSDALFPMLELLVYGVPENTDYDLEAWPEIQVALIGAVGQIRDPRSFPILSAILDSNLVNEAALEETAASLARLESDDVIRFLFSVLDDPSRPARQRRAVLYGIGYCGRTAVAERLADELQRHPDLEEAIILVESLGRAGNWGLWSDPSKQHKDEEASTKRVAAEAALWTYTQYEDIRVRRAARCTVLVVCDPDTSHLIGNARVDAPSETQAAFDRLEELWQYHSSQTHCVQ